MEQVNRHAHKLQTVLSAPGLLRYCVIRPGIFHK